MLLFRVSGVSVFRMWLVFRVSLSVLIKSVVTGHCLESQWLVSVFNNNGLCARCISLRDASVSVSMH